MARPDNLIWGQLFHHFMSKSNDFCIRHTIIYIVGLHSLFHTFTSYLRLQVLACAPSIVFKTHCSEWWQGLTKISLVNYYLRHRFTFLHSNCWRHSSLAVPTFLCSKQIVRAMCFVHAHHSGIEHYFVYSEKSGWRHDGFSYRTQISETTTRPQQQCVNGRIQNLHLSNFPPVKTAIYLFVHTATDTYFRTHSLTKVWSIQAWHLSNNRCDHGR